jgi:uncharacterized protein DUF3168
MSMDDVDVALYALLSGDSTLTALLGSSTSIYRALAPDQAPYPVVIYQTPLPSLDLQVFPGRYLSVYLYDVKAIASGSDSGGVAAQIAKRIDELLENATLNLPHGTVFYCRRKGEINYPEEVANMRFSHVGGTYQIEITP